MEPPDRRDADGAFPDYQVRLPAHAGAEAGTDYQYQLNPGAGVRGIQVRLRGS